MSNEYDIIAKIYDPALYLALRSVRLAVLNELLPYKDKAIIDIRCGTGDQLKLLLKNGFKNLHCLDISRAMLAVAQKNSSQLNFYHKDAADTEFDKGSFDIAIISFALHEKDRRTQENMISEAHRIVKKNGLILIIDYVFDQQSSIIGKIGIHTIERIAGKEHYQNFRSYLQNNGLAGLLKNDQFKLIKESRKLFSGVTISSYQRL